MSSQALQLAQHLRRQGFIVVLALTRPFAFEGPRRTVQANAHIEAMKEAAHLMVGIRRIRRIRGLKGLLLGPGGGLHWKSKNLIVQSGLSGNAAGVLMIL